MRHIFEGSSAPAVGRLSSRMAEPTLPAVLIARPGGLEARVAGASRTGTRAVSLPTITAAAEKEQRAAAGADDEAE